jgi:hypothetical protein
MVLSIFMHGGDRGAAPIMRVYRENGLRLSFRPMDAAERQRHTARGFNPGSETSSMSALKGRGQLNG